MISILWLAACGAASYKSEQAPSAPPPAEPAGGEGFGGMGAKEEEDRRQDAPRAAAAAPKPVTTEIAMDGAVAKKRPAGAKGNAEPADEAGPSLRSWFPESFLWLPSVATDENGVASVDVRVPDTLTTWRVLALGQTRGGAQGGTIGSFESTLPAYVELKTPSFLVSGDRLSLPVQVVNQQTGPLVAPLDVTVRGGSGGGSGSVNVGPLASAVRDLSIVTGGPGTLVIAATLGQVDAVERSIPIRPTGFPVDTTRGGTLGAARTVDLPAVAAGHDGDLSITVWPGAPGYLVGAARDLTPPWEASLSDEVYAYALATRLKAQGGDEVDAATLRAMQLRAWQRILRSTRAPDAWAAALVSRGLGEQEAGSPVATLADRMADTVRRAQQPDGFWTLPAGATIDRAIANAAFCAWAMDNPGARLRAGGAFGRNAPRLVDPVLAAWALVSGSVEEPLLGKLQKTVTDALVVDAEGGRHLPGSGTRPDGRPATDVDATALAALALGKDPAIGADLVTWLLARRGGGDGFTNLLVLEAVSSLLGGEIPKTVNVVVKVDGKEATRGSLDPAQPRAPITLVLPMDAAGHAVEVSAEPAVAGLAWQLRRRTWVDTAPLPPGGVDLRVEVPVLARNSPGRVGVSLTAPSGSYVDLSVGLPAGVVVDETALRPTFASPAPTIWQQDGELRLSGIFVDNGAWSTSIPVVASVTGTLHAGPTRATVRSNPGEPLVQAPVTWSIR